MSVSCHLIPRLLLFRTQMYILHRGYPRIAGIRKNNMKKLFTLCSFVVSMVFSTIHWHILNELSEFSEHEY